MDVRQNIASQKKKASIRLIAPILLFVVIVQIESVYLMIKAIEPELLFAILMIPYSIFFSFVIDKIKCPNCGFKFHNLSVKIRNELQVNVCPHCRVSLDSDCKNT